MSSRQILLIDDDPVNNLINRKLITKIFPDVLITDHIDAGEALARIKTDFTPDLILLDLNMPGMNGWEFLDRFNETGKKTEVYILTSSIDPSDYKKAKRYPQVKKYIEKPLNSSKISALFS